MLLFALTIAKQSPGTGVGHGLFAFLKIRITIRYTSNTMKRLILKRLRFIHSRAPSVPIGVSGW